MDADIVSLHKHWTSISWCLHFKHRIPGTSEQHYAACI